eukprot:446651_1
MMQTCPSSLPMRLLKRDSVSFIIHHIQIHYVSASVSMEKIKHKEKQSIRKQYHHSNGLPSFKASYQTEMSKLKEVDQIQNYLRQDHPMQLVPKDKMYIEAMICYGKMHEYALGYALFEQAKQDGNCRKDTYAAMMWLMLQQNCTVDSVDKCFDLLDELKHLFGWTPSANCYQVLFSNITRMKLWSHGIKLIHQIRKHNPQILHKSHHVRSSIVHFYAKSDHFEKALQFVLALKKEYGDQILANSDYMFSSILSGIAAQTTPAERARSIEIAEKVFKTCYVVQKRPPIASVFSSLIDVYANAGDVDSCLDVLHSMMNRNMYPNPTVMTVTSVFKGLNQDMEYEAMWRVVERLMEVMQSNEIKTDIIFYTNLFSVCGKCASHHECNQHLVDKLKGFYEQMVNVDMLLPTQYALGSLLMNGVTIFGDKLKNMNEDDLEKETIRSELQEFVDWVLSEYKMHHIPINHTTQRNIKQKLNYLRCA